MLNQGRSHWPGRRDGACESCRKGWKGLYAPITERDIPLALSVWSRIACMLPIGLGCWSFLSNHRDSASHLPTLIIGGVAYVVYELLCLCRVGLIYAGLIVVE